jgi:hypothetical protein
MKVKVFKKNKEVGWYKNHVSGANAVIATCRNQGFDITEYYFTEFEDMKKIVWKGEKKMLEAVKSV